MFVIVGCSVLLSAAIEGAANSAGAAYPPAKAMHRGPTARLFARAAVVDRSHGSSLEHRNCVGTGMGTRGAERRPAMSDKSPRQGMSKKSGKSLKEKRAAKQAKSAAKESAAQALFNDKKR